MATGQVLSQSYTGSLICLFHWGNKGRAQEDGEINVLSLLQVHYSALFNPSPPPLLLPPPQFPSVSLLLPQHVLSQSVQSRDHLLLFSQLFLSCLHSAPTLSVFLLIVGVVVCSQSKMPVETSKEACGKKLSCLTCVRVCLC